MPAKPEPRVLGRFGDLDARFDALANHPRARGRPRRSSSGRRVQLQYGCRALFGLVFAGFAGAMLFGIDRIGFGDMGLFMLIPLAFVCVGIGIFVSGAIKSATFSRARTRHVPALVADERTEVTGGKHASTTYYATLQSSTGRREEYEVSDRLAGQLAPGDMGFAEMRAGHLLDFDRVDV